jgi:ribosome-binding protein aMBF1 (putative translation factor)
MVRACIPFFTIRLWDINNRHDKSASEVSRRLLKTKTIREYRLFLKRLKQARLQAGLTQAEVAKLVSRPQSFVSKSESGERRVDFVELLHFAKLYGKPVKYFEI